VVLTTYWGYYGTTDCAGIGLARSNDLVNWVKDPAPLFNQDGERWPSVLHVGGTFYMAHTRDYCGTSHIVLRTSTDGLNFGAYQVLVAPQSGLRNQNPNLFFDPNTNLFYLYWWSSFGVKVRSATTVAGLSNSASEQLLIPADQCRAAPHMLYYNNTYFLSVETNDGVTWSTWIYSSPSPTGPFQLLPDNPILTDGSACLFQHVFGSTLHDYYCKLTGSTWTIDYRSADLTTAGNRSAFLTPPGGPPPAEPGP